MRHIPQARGGLHFHVIIWGGLSPELLECVATVPELMDAVTTVLESQFRTSLPRELHVYDLIKRNKGRTCRGELRPTATLQSLSGQGSFLSPKRGRKRKLGPVLFPKLSLGTGFARRHPSEVPRALLLPPDPDEDWCMFVTFANVTASVFNVHRHCFTCHKGVAGKTGCRLNMPRTKRARTAFVQLLPEKVEDDFDEGDGKKDDIQYTVLEKVQPLHEVKVDPKDSLAPFSELEPRIIAIELGRPLLMKLPELIEDGNEDRRRKEILDNFRESMGYRISLLRDNGHSRDRSARDPFTGQPKRKVPLDSGGFSADDNASSRDPNCLYSAMQHLLFLSGQRVPSVEVIRRRSLEYLAENSDDEVPPPLRGDDGARSLAEMVRDESGLSVDQYCEEKRDADPRTCLWGEAVDVKLLAMCFNVNIAVYRKAEGRGEGKEEEEGQGGGGDPAASSFYSLDDDLSCIPSRNDSARTVHLVCREGLGGDKPPCRECPASSGPGGDTACDLPLHFVPLVPTELLNSGGFFHIDKRLIDRLIEELRPVSVEKLKELYASVSDKLVGRNGYVAEFNEVVSAALGVNTNSLFLGSREQSKSAVFYLGELSA